MAYEIDFLPSDGIKNLWEFITQTIPKLRNRQHVIEIKEKHNRRSNGINAYYFSIVVPAFMSEMGIPDSDSGKEYMHYDLLGKELRQIPDPYREGHTMTQRTSTMDGSEFWKYLNKCNDLFHHYYDYTYPPPKALGYDPDVL